MDTITLTESRAPVWTRWSTRDLTRAQARVAAVALALILAFAFRITALATYGFSQDEIHKVQAIEEYRAGHFAANAEHPMLMKLAMWGSVELAGAWNRIATRDRAVALETAVRLPSAVAGAATTLALFAVAELLFGTNVAVVASVIWALDVNAIATNRIGKEDTFLLLFFLLAVWCYERAKQLGVIYPQGAQRWYTGSGAMFGLMLASKYMPVAGGAYSVFNVVDDRVPGANRPRRFRMLVAALVAFLAVNPAILLPGTWWYAAKYLDGGMLAHHGYLYSGRMYNNNTAVSALGLPVTFYFRYLATKVPLVVLGGAAAGLVELVRRRRERAFVLLRVLLVIQLVVYSLLAGKFLRYMLSVHAVVDLIAAVGLVAVIERVRRSRLPAPARVAAVGGLLAVSLATLASAPLSAAPFYSLYQNALGARLARPGVTFSEETYDYGVREAVAAIADAAEPGAVIVSDVPDVVAQYMTRSGRSDLELRWLSSEGIPNGPREAWVLVQDEHIYFENQAVIGQLRGRLVPWREIRAGDALALQVFRLEGR